MILILTYHRIIEGAAEGFFDVTAAEFKEQLRRAKNAWGKNTSPQILNNPVANDDKTGFLITFDDGTVDHFTTAAPILEQNGLTGVFFVNTDLIGKDGYLNLTQCHELVARGHAVESHSHEHKTLDSLSAEELRQQLTESRRRLKEWNLGQWDLLAPPGGYFNSSVMESARRSGYSALRTLEWGYNRKLEAFRLQSITINRKTAGGWFDSLISPKFELAKSLFYKTKETVKGRLPGFYTKIRHLRGAK